MCSALGYQGSLLTQLPAAVVNAAVGYLSLQQARLASVFTKLLNRKDMEQQVCGCVELIRIQCRLSMHSHSRIRPII